MITIPHRKIKSREATMTYLLDPARLRSFIVDLRAYLRSTQHLFQKKGCENDPRNCKHRGMHDRPEPVLFRRFHHFCYVSIIALIEPPIFAVMKPVTEG